MPLLVEQRLFILGTVLEVLMPPSTPGVMSRWWSIMVRSFVQSRLWKRDRAR
jgi:hypothetical protein